jgi:light-regulated signal transduction histidine kinase (bacteriophytochrome)
MTEAELPAESLREQLGDEYAEALAGYLDGAGESALSLAYELGRRAVTCDLGVVDMVALHHRAVQSRAASTITPQQIQAAGEFLAESLASFELTHRGFREANLKLARVNDMLREKNAELAQSARALRRAKEAAEASNRELEAFSYSVSHDLRTPLRAIDGFSQALLEDYADQLDETGRHRLRRVRAGAQKMSELIEAMLLLSRVGGNEVKRRDLDLSALASQVAEDLRGMHGTQVALHIEPGLCVHADPRLMRIVLENLLGNAWKFSAKNPSPRIDVGADDRPDGKVFFVRDNGAGFDMAYADKLFAPFRRLHDEKDFAGSGIGLATVQRVIHRHGGRIWAESVVNGGATFFFTIPDFARA